ncbi:hypothetical protein [Tautonia plasticadhaerens]|uniref:PEP-CTERM protein-sorting domain-containing protein n=1 Tax=Tautonia plasticadhaerens TaxID=2527974 RepID=A0A518HB04_9BACT|nr:hypothetical protein [Tautonia plasticadhaerens]QDV38045.1 hypothetical protein ElP_59930 [Tautonia plasticadhaerens]
MRTSYLWQSLVLASLALSGLAPAARADAIVLPPHSVVEGRTIAEYTTDWWNWAFSFSLPDDPFTDPTGAAANMNQSGPVFFLAGTTGSTANRTFTVPADTYLLVPLLNFELSQLELGDFSLTEAQIRSEVNGVIDLVDELHASIDGVAVPNLFDHREESPAFEYFAAPDNLFDLPTGPSGIAVADGYWLMLAPIAAGETHVINYGGGVSAFDFRVDVTATLTAIPEPSSLVLCGAALCGIVVFMSRRGPRSRTRPADSREGP